MPDHRSVRYQPAIFVFSWIATGGKRLSARNPSVGSTPSSRTGLKDDALEDTDFTNPARQGGDQRCLATLRTDYGPLGSTGS
jgi:hypothetical protein